MTCLWFVCVLGGGCLRFVYGLFLVFWVVFMVCLWFWGGGCGLWMFSGVFMICLWFISGLGGVVFMICSRFIYCLGGGCL